MYLMLWPAIVHDASGAALLGFLTLRAGDVSMTSCSFSTMLTSFFLNTTFLFTIITFSHCVLLLEVTCLCHPCDGTYSDSHSDTSRYCSIPLPTSWHVHIRPCTRTLMHFHLFAEAMPFGAIKRLIYWTWKLIISKDSSSGDNKGRGNPEKIELDWFASEKTNGAVTRLESENFSRTGSPVNHNCSAEITYRIQMSRHSKIRWTIESMAGYKSRHGGCVGCNKLQWFIRFLIVTISLSPHS